MKRAILTSAILGLMAIPASAQPGPTSQYNQIQLAQACTSCGTGAQRPALLARPLAMPYRTNAACGRCGSSDSYGEGHYRGERLEKLIDFLLYRPTIPCDCCLRPSEYMPPMIAYFPNRCSAVGGDCLGGHGCKRLNSHYGCASCAATLGNPMVASRPESRIMPASHQAMANNAGNGPTAKRSLQPGQYTTAARPPFLRSGSASGTPNELPSFLQPQSPYSAVRIYPQVP
jgi:hypothetical protein